ncbi:MAG: ABC transporter ATP-binding protein [Clostridia bacterium]|nr:ABC transporter ATP-binding protein [Clostridia bacterium]
MKFSTIRRFIRYYRPHMKLFSLDMLCALVVSIIDLVYPSVAEKIIDSCEGLAAGTGTLTAEGILRTILLLGALLLVIYIVKMGCNMFIAYWGHVIGTRMQGHMRHDVFHHLQTLPLKYYDNTETGTIMSKVYNDLFDVSELAHHAPENFFLAGIMMIGSFVILVQKCWQLTLIIFLFVPIIVAFALFMRKRMHEAFSSCRKKTGEMNADVQNSVSGIRVTRAYTSRDHELDKFDRINGEFVAASSYRYKSMGQFHSGMTFLMDLLYLMALVGGGIFLYRGAITIGAFTAFLLYINSFLKPINMLVALFEQVQEGATGFERFLGLMDEPEEKDDPGAVAVDKVEGTIAFEHVSFDYRDQETIGDDKLLIHDLNIEIPAGKTVALVGPSGGGKTTLCHLIPRFYEISDGRILIDGQDIRSMTRDSLRANIGIVAQDVFLFNGTIRENIAYGNFNASQQEIEEAARRANIHDHIMSLPEGYDTNVGERGVRLSGGQKQRISIARAFLKNPPILILDEATSALDNATEMQIQASLEELGRGRTEIVVAHRLSTVKKADEIIVIDERGVAERGTHEELMEQDGIYAGLYRYQFREA